MFDLGLWNQKMGIKLQYTLYGMLFGCCFPIFALILQMTAYDLPFSLDGIFTAHKQNILIYMIDSAPIFLGLFALLGGISKAKAVNLVNEFKQMAENLNSSNHNFTKSSDNIFSVLINSTNEINTLTQQLKSSNETLFGTNSSNADKAETLNSSTHTLISSTNQLIKLNREVKGTNDNIYGKVDKLQSLIDSLSINFKKINSIGNEIKILSINSSIEAQRYGSSGSGFKVIANQIKALSENIEHLNRQTEDTTDNVHIEVSQLHEIIDTQNNNLQIIIDLIQNIESNTETSQNHLSNIYANIEQAINIQNDQKDKFDTVSEKINDLSERKDSLIDGLRSVMMHNSGLITKISQL